MVVILVALVAATVFVLWRNFGEEVIGDRRERRRLPRHFQCTKCDHKFELTSKEFNLQHKGAHDSVPGLAHCPECGERFCSRMTSECPHCGEYGTWIKPRTGPNRGKEMCPNCNKVLDPAQNTGPNSKRGRGR